MTPRVLVIGGGPAGSICALSLRRFGHDVLLIDRSRNGCARLAETCGAKTHRKLVELCRQPVPDKAWRPLTTIHSAWGAAELDGRNLAFWEGSDGLVLDRAILDAWLWELAEHAGATVRRNCQLVRGRQVGNGWQVTLGGHSTEQAEVTDVGLVVEATGRSSRSLLQAETRRRFADKLICVSLELPVTGTEHDGATIEACRHGWWFTVVAPDAKRHVAFFTDADLFAGPDPRSKLQSLLKETKHIRALVGALPGQFRIHTRDARTSARSLQWRANWLSIGDAASCLDPLSGSGLDRAVRDGDAAAARISHVIYENDFQPLWAHVIDRANEFLKSLDIQWQYYAIETRWRHAPFWRRRTIQMRPQQGLPAVGQRLATFDVDDSDQ